MMASFLVRDGVGNTAPQSLDYGLPRDQDGQVFCPTQRRDYHFADF